MKKFDEIVSKLLYIIVLIFFNTISFGQTIDSDNDGVEDKFDLCQNTPVGTIVNVYGCPVDKANCDYQTSSFSLLSNIAPIGKQTKYILADAVDGNIIQINDIPTYNNLVGTKTYMALSISYEDNNTIVNLQINKKINQVSASCFDFSNALLVKVCVPPPITDSCDFTTSLISFNSTAKPTGFTTKYVFATEANTIIGISDITQFNISSLSGTNKYNLYSVSFQGDVNNLELGKKVNEVNGACLDWSNPLPIKVCICKPTCIPIRVTKSKNI